MRRTIVLAAVALALPAPVAPQESVRTVARLDFAVVEGPALSPDGAFLAVGGWDRGLFVVDVASGRSWPALQASVGRLDWAPRGDLIAFSRWDEEVRNNFIWSLPIDPRTGRPAGEARRVSVSPGYAVAFSPDGESIAFAASTDAGERVVVLPARGGRERVLSQAEAGITSIAWSDDGEWIYYAHETFGGPWGYVSRVRRTGGAPELVWETPAGTPWVIEPGPRIVQEEGGRQAGFVHQPGGPHSSPAVSLGTDRIRILDRTGRNVLSTITPPPGADLWISAASADGARFFGTQADREFRLMAVALADGTATELDRSPTRQVVATGASSDGVAFRTEVGGALGLVVTSPDGRGRREYSPRARPSPAPLDNRGRYVLSPDGSRLAYVAMDSLEHLVVLDVRTGDEHVLASGARLQFRWTSDGQLQLDRVADRVRPSRRSVHLVKTDGTERMLRVLSEQSSLGEMGVQLVSDTMVVVGTLERVAVIPLGSGEPRVVFRGPHTGTPSVSPDHRYLAVKTVSRVAPRHGREEAFIEDADAIAIIDLATGRRRDLQLDLISPRIAGPAVWHPDGAHLLVNLARNSNTWEWDTYLVPINGDRPRVLVRDVFPTNGNYPVLTDDGNTVLVTVAGPPATRILELSAAGRSGSELRR